MDGRLRAAVAAWQRALAARILYWVNNKGIRQSDLSKILEYNSPSAVNQALNNPEKISQNFVERLSRNVPEFADSIRQYRELVDSGFGAGAEETEAAERILTKDKQVEDLKKSIGNLEDLLKLMVESDD